MSEPNHNEVQRMLDKIRVEGKLGKGDVEKLRKLFGTRAGKALQLAMDGRVEKYFFEPSGRAVWVVVGRSQDYLLYPYAPYCSCDDFYFAIQNGKAYVCQHLIAWKLATSLGLYETIREHDGMYERLTTSFRFVARAQRLSLAVEGDYESDAIDFISEKVERHGSDMRLGIRLLINAINLAVQEKSDLTWLVANQAWENEKLDYWEKEYLEMHPHQAALLCIAFWLMEKTTPITSTQLYKEYNEQCLRLGVKPMTNRQLSKYLENLETSGFLTTRTELTKLGKTTYITSDLTPKMMVEAGRRIDWAAHLK